MILLMASCSSTKFVPEDQYLLDKYKLKVDAPGIREKELSAYVRPKPNKKVLVLNFILDCITCPGKRIME